jgi:hypothetical protein
MLNYTAIGRTRGEQAQEVFRNLCADQDVTVGFGRCLDMKGLQQLALLIE